MAGLQIQGATGSVVEAGAFAAKGLHSIAKPQDYGALGHYAMVLQTGTIAAGMAALGELVQMRWVDATRFCLIQEIQVLEFRVTTAFTAGRFLFDACIARSWSADGTGGNQVTVTGDQGQLRTNMGASLFSTGFRLATTAALGAGTKTLDTNPFGATFGNVGAVGAKTIIPQSMVVTTAEAAAGPGVVLWKCDIASGEHPIVLASNGGSTSDGIAIRATVPATGTWQASFLVKWAEVAAF
jgi:hypothetical protein